jgi:hypothetical protein
MQNGNSDFIMMSHFTILIYPFVYDRELIGNEERLDLLNARWESWWQRFDAADIGEVLDDTYFFLPYIRDVLFPETNLLQKGFPGEGYQNWVRKINLLKVKGINNLVKELPQHPILRLTLRATQILELRALAVTDISARMEWIDMLLFPEGTGFLVAKVLLDEQQPTLGKLISFNSVLQVVHPPYLAFKLPDVYFKDSQVKVAVGELVDFLLQGITEPPQKGGIPSLAKYTAELKKGTQPRYTKSEHGQVYGERFHVLSYACPILPEQKATDHGPFGSLADRLLYEYATGTPLGYSISQPQWMPSEEQVARLNSDNRIYIWECWRGVSLRDTTVFLGTEDIEFNQKHLPHNIEFDYLPLYLYSLHQKIQLYIFSNNLMRKGANFAENLRDMRNLMEQFIHFGNRYWFNEITQKPVGSILYTKFQQGLGTKDLYDIVSSEVKEIQNYYEERQAKRVNTLLNVLAFIFVPLSAIISFFGMNFVVGSWRIFLLTCGAIGMLSLGTYAVWGHRKD